MSRFSEAASVLTGRKVTTESRPRPPLGRRIREAVRVLRGDRRAVSRLRRDGRLAVTEAHGGQDPDLGLGYDRGGHNYFRRLTQNARDLPDLDFRDMIRVAVHLTRTNPYARRIIELRTNYVLGDGVSVICQDKDVQEVVDTFWTDPVNKIERRLHSWVSSWRTMGELILPVVVNPVSGLVRLGYISPDRVARVIPYEYNVGEAKALKLYDGHDEDGVPVEGQVFEVIHVNEDMSDPDADGLRAGDVLYVAANRLPDMTRGLSDLYPIADYLEALEQTVWNLTESSAIRNAFVLHVVYEGLDEDEIAERHDRNNSEPPRPGEVVATNDKVDYNFLTPSFGSSDASQWVDVLISAIATGADVPPWVLGKADDPNRASAREFTGPMLRSLKELQRETVAWLTDLVDFQIDQAIRAGRLPQNVDRSFQVVTPELEARDVASDATAAQSGIQTLVLALSEELVDTMSAQDATAELLSRIGPDLDGPTIRERLATEAEEREAELAKADHGIAGPEDPYAGTGSEAGAQATTCPHCGADAAPNLPCPDCHGKVPGDAPPAPSATQEARFLEAPPWSVVRQNGQWCVVQDEDGTVEACHATRDEAEEHMAALYANVDDVAQEELGALTEAVASIRESIGGVESRRRDSERERAAWPTLDSWPGAGDMVDAGGRWVDSRHATMDEAERDALVEGVLEAVVGALAGPDGLADLEDGDDAHDGPGASLASLAERDGLRLNRQQRRALEAWRRKNNGKS